MRHNKIVGWDRFFGVIEKVHQLSPWLSRQIAKRAAEWPFWFSGIQIRDWESGRVWVHLPRSMTNSVDHEICQGHLVLAAELALRLVLLAFRQEFPFQFRLSSTRVETHHRLDQAVDIKLAIGMEEWERIRLELARGLRTTGEFAFSACLSDGRLGSSFQFTVAFELEKFLPA